MEKYLTFQSKRKASEDIIKSSDSEHEDENCEQSGSKKQKKKANKTVQIRKYDNDYLKFGFIESNNLPQCVLCSKTLSNSSMAPAKLKRHLEQNHPEHKDKSLDFFERKKVELGKQKTFVRNAATVSTSALKASFAASLRIAKEKKPHTIGETLILPAAIDMVEIMLGSVAAQKLKTIPLSNDTVSRRISSLAEDIKSQLFDRLRQCSHFAIQCDETTDVSNNAQLITYVRYPYEGSFYEDILFCKDLPSYTTGEEIFNMFDNFFRNELKLSWGNCVAICTDGAAAMTGKVKGLIARIKELNPTIISVHCTMHRSSLASKKMSDELSSVLQSAVKVINFIKARPLNNRLFELLCKNFDAEHTTLLLHAEVRFLSRGRTLARLFELRNEVKLFLDDHNEELSALFCDNNWLAKLAYLSDIFGLINAMNLSLQGPDACLLKSHDKIVAFQKKLSLWIKRFDEDVTEMFPSLSEFLNSDTELDILELKNCVCDHLKSLSAHFAKYFPDIGLCQFEWVRDPFNDNSHANSALNSKAEEQLIELSCDGGLKLRFTALSICDFWLSVKSEYPELALESMKVLLPFATTYLSETGFSALTVIKTKYRSRLDPENDLFVAISNIVPNIDKLCQNMQAQVSH